MTGSETRRHYRQLGVWQKAMELAVSCYQSTHMFPKHELYGLTSQLRRAAASIPANIAEGRGRRHTREYIHHLSVAAGSLAELETHVELAARLGYVSSEAVMPIYEQCSEVGRMLNGLAKSLETKL